MTRLEELVRLAAAELESAGRAWALVGGLAISARLEPRFTRDVDLAVAVDDDREAEALIRRFRDHGFEIRMLVEQEAKERLATVRLAPVDEETAPVIDLLFASCGIEPEIAEAAEPIAIADSLVVPVATLGHLLAMKVLARKDDSRPQDHVDIRNILAVIPDEEVDRARAALALIAERGFHRNKDLLMELGELSRV